jgi:hypothetical protein
MSLKVRNSLRPLAVDVVDHESMGMLEPTLGRDRIAHMRVIWWQVLMHVLKDFRIMG